MTNDLNQLNHLARIAAEQGPTPATVLQEHECPTELEEPRSQRQADAWKDEEELNHRRTATFVMSVAGFAVSISQDKDGVFCISYGNDRLRYAHSWHEAAQALGNCILHGLCCEGVVRGGEL